MARIAPPQLEVLVTRLNWYVSKAAYPADNRQLLATAFGLIINSMRMVSTLATWTGNDIEPQEMNQALSYELSRMCT